MNAQPALRRSTDLVAWESDWRGFVVNERPIVQRVAEPTLLLTLKPDCELIPLFRAHHQMHSPIDGGDVVVEHRLSRPRPQRLSQGDYTIPLVNTIAYTMTLVLPLPDALPWLCLVFAAGGCWCSYATRPDRELLWPPAPAGLTAHLILIVAMFSMPLKEVRN